VGQGNQDLGKKVNKVNVDYTPLLLAALSDLGAAVKDLTARLTPDVPLPQPRAFRFTDHISWPKTGSSPCDWDAYGDCGIKVGGTNYPLTHEHALQMIANQVLGQCGHQPRKILRALRRIQAATAWCRARTEGRERMAEEILRQQAKAVEALDAEAAMVALR
jgi:hypothetical protein